MNLLRSARAAEDRDFRLRVQTALVITALELTRGEQLQTDERTSAALQVTLHPDNPGWQLNRFAWLVAADKAVAETTRNDGTVEATDDVIFGIVERLWVELFPDAADDSRGLA